MSQPHGTITPARPENPANPETSPQEGQYEITVPTWPDTLAGGVPPTFRTADPLGSLTGKDEKLAGKYKTYSPEFKEEAAKLVINTSRPIADVARELKISETSLGNWVRAYREKHAEDEPPLQVSERARLRELERLNRELEMENAFLKKAAAYFAREHR